MSTPTYDVLGIGNALVDVLAKCDQKFVEDQGRTHGMIKNSMNLIPEQRAIELYALMGPAVEMSGGSAANTIAHLAALGGRGAFIGKVADDQLGEVFRHDLRAMGIDFDTTPLILGPKTGRSLILVTPDAIRTMNTYLGAATELRPEDIDPAQIGAAAITFLEGYLFDQPHSKKAFFAAGGYAHSAGRRVALTLSDSFCVARHRDDFITLITETIDILFANEHELKDLAQTDDLTAALKFIEPKCDIVAVTLGDKGSLVLADGQKTTVPPVPVTQVVDTTGAGDAYAAGFLYGLTHQKSWAECGAIASKAAASVLGYMGPRPLKKAA
jgi:sugar/nucleoside kinase (ribokinase family)